MQNEIDLLQNFARLFGLLRKHVVAVVVLLVIAGGVSVVLYSWLPKKYESQLVASSKFIRPEALVVAFSALNRAMEDRNFSLVAQYLGLEQTDVFSLETISLQDIRPMTFTTGRDKEKEYERIAYFEIRITTALPVDYVKIQKGVLTFLESNEFVQARVRVYEETGKAQLEKLNLEVERLNELRQELFKGSKAYTLLDPSALNQTIVDISREARELEIELRLNSPVQVIQGFIAYDRPVFPRRKHAVIGTALLWVLFTGVFLITRK